jgi:hypothetical protein
VIYFHFSLIYFKIYPPGFIYIWFIYFNYNRIHCMNNHLLSIFPNWWRIRVFGFALFAAWKSDIRNILLHSFLSTHGQVSLSKRAELWCKDNSSFTRYCQIAPQWFHLLMLSSETHNLSYAWYYQTFQLEECELLNYYPFLA